MGYVGEFWALILPTLGVQVVAKGPAKVSQMNSQLHTFQVKGVALKIYGPLCVVVFLRHLIVRDTKLEHLFWELPEGVSVSLCFMSSLGVARNQKLNDGPAEDLLSELVDCKACVGRNVGGADSGCSQFPRCGTFPRQGNPNVVPKYYNTHCWDPQKVLSKLGNPHVCLAQERFCADESGDFFSCGGWV